MRSIAQIWLDYCELVYSRMTTIIFCNEIFYLMDLRNKNRYKRIIIIK